MYTIGINGEKWRNLSIRNSANSFDGEGTGSTELTMMIFNNILTKF